MFQTSDVVMTEPSASSLPMETSSSPTVPLQVGVFCVTCGIITSILVQAADVVKTEPLASSLPTEALSSPPDPLQVDEPSREDVEAQSLADSSQVGRFVVLFLDQSYWSSIRGGRGGGTLKML